MKRKFTLIVVAMATCIAAGAQQKLTTFILLRHAEKVSDGSKDPDLTEQGKRRAENLVALCKNTPLQAIYATSFPRNGWSIGESEIAVREYEAFKPEPIDKILSDFEVLICGHSNNIPWIANYLTGDEKFKIFDDNDYDNLLMVTVAERGK